MSPILKKACKEKSEKGIFLYHDPFKSDIYSLALILLEVYLRKIGL